MAKKQKQPVRDAHAAESAASPSRTSFNKSAQASSTRPIWRNVNTQKALYLITLAGIVSPLSQLTLAPVYGSIPSATYHKYGLIACSLLAFALRGNLPDETPNIIPALAFWVPSIQFLLFKYSSQLGLPYGPLVTELLTCFPLITLSLYHAARLADELDLGFLGPTVAESAPSMFFYMIFTIIQRTFRDVLPQWIGGYFISSRMGLQLVIATLYGLILPSSLFWPSVPSVALTMIANIHTPLQRTTGVLHDTLALYDYKLLERHESVTGYVSVLEDTKKGFRVMRCDHSLLGGEWKLDPTSSHQPQVGEPIYAVFAMLEAVRLVEIKPRPASSKPAATKQKKALNIGLGVGTAPTALITHGIDTTIIELDPVIHYFAGKYFNLPKNHSYHIGDAVPIVEQRAQQIAQLTSSSSSSSSTNDQEIDKLQYDYIIHDAFTGGAVPTPLFTHEFLTSLSLLLNPETGVIAINYAGDLNLPSSSMIHRTITSVFESCRVFREEPAVVKDKNTEDFTNLVYFCLAPVSSQEAGKPTTNRKITFRKPVVSDYLGSGARQQFLLPTPEQEIVDFTDNSQLAGDNGDVLSLKNRKSMKLMEGWQRQSAEGHWRVMRNVVRDEIWENW